MAVLLPRAFTSLVLGEDDLFPTFAAKADDGFRGHGEGEMTLGLRVDLGPEAEAAEASTRRFGFLPGAVAYRNGGRPAGNRLGRTVCLVWVVSAAILHLDQGWLHGLPDQGRQRS